jgi:hydroxyacyl-ACP dehydratase HTD2-like protein with hotdog domain
MSTRIATIKIGDDLPAREFHCNNVQQFFYNAALWNAHRIHFDFPYATEVEGYAGLVVAGPLMGDWLTQCVTEWLNEDGSLLSFEYSNRKAAYTGEVLRVGGKVISVNTESGRVELELQVRNEADEVVAPGAAVARFPVT